jgi:ribonuclease R
MKGELAKREDVRSLPVITIDGLDAKDLDDAISIEHTEDG